MLAYGRKKMNCLCCGKPLTDQETSGWHKKCIGRFFGVPRLPEIEINQSTLDTLATESTGKGFTVPGVQKKLSLHLFSDKKTPRLTLVNYPTGYILKPQVPEINALPEAEHMAMLMAEATGIATVPHALLPGKEGFAYITKRVDRKGKQGKEMLAMEDFCQLDLRLTQDKYKGSYERCAKVVERYSSRKGLDMTELYLRLVFSFVIGNSDMHLKNFSLIETAEGSGLYVLSPAYDLLPVNVLLPEDKEQFALTLNGKKRNLHRKDFFTFANSCGISKIAAEKMMADVVRRKPMYLSFCEESFLPELLKEQCMALIAERCKILE